MPKRPAAASSPLGPIDPARFLRTVWQRRPLLIRRALPPAELATAFPIADTLALARDPDVESRLVEAPTADGRRGWRLTHGPFERLPSRRRPGWTVLVQGVDLHRAAGRALMDRFRFIPDARLDDLMISVATDGGGVGPHVDSYDVFLLQAHGRRRWRVGPPASRRAPHRLAPDLPLKILSDFQPTEDWILEPGDLLYLPPGWGHDGAAIGECMTCSIGFRSPSPDELRRAFFAALADAEPPRPAGVEPPRQRYRDPALAPTGTPARIPPAMLDTLADWIRRFRPDEATIMRFIGRHLTEPKPTVWFDAAGDGGDGGDGDDMDEDDGGPGSGPGSRDDGEPGDGRGLVLDRRTRMLYAGDEVYINGEALRPARRGLAILQQLADRRALDAAGTARAMRDPALRATLEDWLSSGWLHHAGD